MSDIICSTSYVEKTTSDVVFSMSDVVFAVSAYCYVIMQMTGILPECFFIAYGACVICP